MNLLGGIPLIAAALLGGGASGSAAAIHPGGNVPAAVASPPISLPAGAPTPVLQQTGRTWETTLLLSSISPACHHLSGVRYWLVTTRPDTVIPGNAAQPLKSEETDSTGSFGSSCQVKVTFQDVNKDPDVDLTQVPATATLVLDQHGTSSMVAVTVSRNVTLNDYLVIPAITGGAVTILSLILSVLLVRRYDRKRHRSPSGIRRWLTRPILGSGAWTANDSWATNISTGLVVVGAVLAATPAVDPLFPGVALDRFAIVNIVAGFFVAVAPVLFGILYSGLTTSRPGLIADATVKLPGLRPATVSVPSGASITLAADTTIRYGSEGWATVRGGGTYQVAPGATIQVVAGIQEIAQSLCEKAKLAVAVVPAEEDADTSAKAAGWFKRVVERALRALLQRSAGVQAARRGGGQAGDTGVQAGMQALELAIEQALMQPDHPDVELTDDNKVRQKITEALGQEGVRTAAENVVRAATGAPGSAGVPAGVDVIKAMRCAVRDIPRNGMVYNAMACSGTADIGVLPGSVLRIDQWAGTLTIQASDVLDQPSPAPVQPDVPEPVAPYVHLVQVVPATPAGPSAVPLGRPVFISATGGAKVTVTGAADLTLPTDTQIWTPHEDRRISAPRKGTQNPDPHSGYYPLRKPARLMVPQGTNVMVANLGIILIVNFLTMFGIGAELGIASVLADFSGGIGPGHAGMSLALAAVAVLVVIYAATATRTMADPQPGSSISSQAGTSFTL